MSDGPEPTPSTTADRAPTARVEPRRSPRPLIERIGMAAIAASSRRMFGGVAFAAWFGGEPFLAVMGGDRLPDDRVGRRPDPVPGLSPISNERFGLA